MRGAQRDDRVRDRIIALRSGLTPNRVRDLRPSPRTAHQPQHHRNMSRPPRQYGSTGRGHHGVCVVLADRVAGILTFRARMTRRRGVMPATTGMTVKGTPYPLSRRRPGPREPPCGLVPGHPPGIPACSSRRSSTPSLGSGVRASSYPTRPVSACAGMTRGRHDRQGARTTGKGGDDGGDSPAPSSPRKRGSRKSACGPDPGHPPGVPAYAGMTRGRPG